MANERVRLTKPILEATPAGGPIDAPGRDPRVPFNLNGVLGAAEARLP